MTQRDPHHHILIADDARMPTDQDWLLIEHAGGVLVVMRRSIFTGPALVLTKAWAEAWSAFRWMSRQTDSPPALRVV